MVQRLQRPPRLTGPVDPDKENPLNATAAQKPYYFAYQEWDRMPKWRAFMSYDRAAVEEHARHVLTVVRSVGRGWALQWTASPEFAHTL